MSVKRVRRVRWGRVAAAIIGGALAVTLLTGAYSGDQKLVETVYTVREGDTLREISERFLPLNNHHQTQQEARARLTFQSEAYP